MEATITPNQNQRMSLGKAAVVAGIGVLIMAVTVPIVEFYIFPTLIDYKNATQTITNITNHTSLFSTAILIHLLTVICDVIVAWALYIFLKPVGRHLALLTAWFRLAYTGFNIAALLNLIQILAPLRVSEKTNLIQSGQINDYVIFHLHSFDLHWRLGLIFFGIYLCLLSYLVFRANYVPTFVGLCLLVAGLGYLIDNLKYFLYPDFNTGFLWFTYFGELVFMLWLLIRGSRIRQFNKMATSSI